MLSTTERILRDKAEELGLSIAYQENMDDMVKSFSKSLVEYVLASGVEGRNTLDLIAEKTFDEHFKLVEV